MDNVYPGPMDVIMADPMILLYIAIAVYCFMVGLKKGKEAAKVRPKRVNYYDKIYTERPFFH